MKAFGKNQHIPVVSKFARFRLGITDNFPFPFTSKDSIELDKEIGREIRIFVRGGNKKGYLRRMRNLDKRAKTRERTFYFETWEQLAAALLWMTENPEYVKEVREHEFEHLEVLERFAKKHKLHFDTCFLIEVYTDGEGSPGVQLYKNSLWVTSRKWLGVIDWVGNSGNALLESWPAKTLRAFYQMLSENNGNGSKSDHAKFGN
ncbi:MAG: hypothetical protein ABH814_02755 [bacterium]